MVFRVVRDWLGKIVGRRQRPESESYAQELEYRKAVVEEQERWVAEDEALKRLEEAETAYESGDVEEAGKIAAAVNRAVPDFDPALSILARAAAKLRKPREAREWLSRMTGDWAGWSCRHVAATWVLIDECELALTALAGLQHDGQRVQVRDDPDFAALRTDPTFERLVRRVGRR